MDTTISRFRKELRRQIELKRHVIGNGHYEKIEDYRAECARIAGLEDAESILNSIIQRLQKADSPEDLEE